jgi:death-on-curing protein
MKEPIFLKKDQVLQLHSNALEDYYGRPGLRDYNLLESAIAQPKSSFDGVYLNESIFKMAAAYYFHISQNQPFIDGNKRAGFLSTFMFLKINGYNLNSSNDVTYPFLIDVAEGRKTKDDLAKFIEQHSTKIV